MTKTFLSKADVQANREFDRKLRAKIICAACGAEFGKFNATYKKVVVRDARLNDCCEICARDF